MKYVCGVDPGLSGCVCLYNPDDVIFYDMPTLEIIRHGKNKRQLDLYALAKFIDLHAVDIEKAYIEKPGAMPGQGSSSMFAFGFNCGAVQMVIASAFIPMDLIPPATWKKAMGLSSSKDASRLKASQMFPRWSEHWLRKKDEGRCEALLTAAYGLGLR